MDANLLTFHAVVLRGIPGRWACPGCMLQKGCQCTCVNKVVRILTYGCCCGVREDRTYKTAMGKYKTILESTDFFSSFFVRFFFVVVLF